MTDIEIGRKVFKAFHDWNKTFNSTAYTLSFDEFLNSYGKKKDIYLDGIGGAVREAGMSDYAFGQAMRSMALQSKGKIPKNPLDMIKYLQDEATQINWVDAVAYTVVESAKDIGSGAVAVGDSLLTTAKIINFLLPVIGLLFVYFWLNKKSGGELGILAGKGIKAGARALK